MKKSALILFLAFSWAASPNGAHAGESAVVYRPKPVKKGEKGDRSPATIEIRGDKAFVRNTVKALDFINKTPDYYNFVAAHVKAIEEDVNGDSSGMMAYADPPAFRVATKDSRTSTHWYASAIVHDAHHSYEYHNYKKKHGNEIPPADAWTGEAAERRALETQKIF